MRIFLSTFLYTSLLFSENISSSLTFQGFTGLINTPNAQVIREGDAIFHYGNSKDNHLRNYNYNESMSNQENFVGGIGFLSSLELSGKLVENKGRARDLSANIKYLLPYKSKYLPNIALGWQDLGSAYNFYGNRYIVMDKEFSFLRASVGYGNSINDIGAPRMNGIFGGIEANILNVASIMIEHDGKENHAGIRLKTPKEWLSSNISLEATIAQNLTESDTSFSLNLNIPLFNNSKQNKMIYKKIGNQNIIEESISPKKIVEKDIIKPIDGSLQNIEDRLASIGFENIQVGSYNKSIYIKLENSIFDHNDLDALGVIMGTIIDNSTNKNHYIITLLKNNIQILTISGSVDILSSYFQNPTIDRERNLKNNLRFTKTFNEKDVLFLNQKRVSSRFIPRLELSPALTTTVGTEVGVFDYLVGLHATAYMNLADGLTISSSYEIPLFHSQNFDNGYVFAKTYKERLESRFVNSMLNQTLKYESILNTTSIGQFQTDYLGLLNHFNFTTVSGEHGFNVKVGRFKNQKEKSDDTRDIYMGSYRYFYAPLELFTELSYGQYWNQDRGAMIEMKRFFGDTAVSFYLKNAVKTYAGFQVSIPLSPRKLAKASTFGQIKGKSDFSYGIRTVVKSPDNANYLNSVGGIFPQNDLELTDVYLNRDRLSGSYIKNHLNKLRESFIFYIQE